MKRTLFICLFTLTIGSKSFGQGLPVYDNTSFLSMIQQLAAMGTQTAEIIKTVNFMADAVDRIQDVSGVIRDINTVARLIDRNRDIYELLNNDVRNLISNPVITPNEAERLYDKVERLWDITQEDVALIEQILEDNVFKMEDTDRMTKIREAEKNADETYNTLKIEIRDYNTIVEFRELQQAINNARNN